MVFVGSESFDMDPDSVQFLILIRIQGNETDSTDPDPQHCTAPMPNLDPGAEHIHKWSGSARTSDLVVRNYSVYINVAVLEPPRS